MSTALGGRCESNSGSSDDEVRTVCGGTPQRRLSLPDCSRDVRSLGRDAGEDSVSFLFLSIHSNWSTSISHSGTSVAVRRMNFRSTVRVIAVGLTTFLVITVAVTELLQSRIEFSLLVGIPVGLVAGVIITALLVRGFADGPSERERWISASFGAVSIAVLVVIVAGALLQVGTTMAAIAGTIVGLVTAVWLSRRDGERAHARRK